MDNIKKPSEVVCTVEGINQWVAGPRDLTVDSAAKRNRVMEAHLDGLAKLAEKGLER
jgi:hypothetical protein